MQAQHNPSDENQFESLARWAREAAASLDGLAEAIAKFAGEFSRQLDTGLREWARQVDWSLRGGKLVAVLEDPATWPHERCSLLRQIVAIFKHEFWTAAGEPHRSPGYHLRLVRR